MASKDKETEVSKALKNLENLDELKKLFCKLLNYQRVNKKVSLRQLTDSVTKEIEGEPLLLAEGGANNEFHVIYTRFQSKNIFRQVERDVINNLHEQHPYALFVFSNQSQSRWHFINVKYDESSHNRKMLLRRITVGDGEKLRTAAERISLLDLESISDKSPLGIQTRHDEAFDVEAVTKEFFKTYDKIFKEVKKDIEGISDEDKKHLFTQKLFNRLLFIAFIQKKGWLTFNEETNYLSALWNDYDKNKGQEGNFYKDRLSKLFFQGLNTPEGNREELKGVIGSVPFLNGGLFEQEEDDKNQKIMIPDDCINDILNDLFQPFNFTVTESTPLDVEVAVDPEMLGKVFEELVTGRHDTGSYYTPKPIVSFMCKEGLKGYLGREYEGLIDNHDTEGITVDKARKLLDKLESLKVVDPACGSGAYLLEMLHELHAITRLLDTRAEKDTPRDDYRRKLSIIQNNLYGVDNDNFAVNIAKLRLWLSLAVEFDGYPPEPLPNLDFIIQGGDSLTAIIPETVIKDELIIQYQQAYQQAKDEYMNLGKDGDKKKLKKKIEDLETKIATQIHDENVQKGFDWVVKFAEVFAEGGFDIVLANPPYVRQELITKLKPTLEKVYPSVYTGKSDLYCFFYARALELLKSGGMLAFISSNKWFRAKYGESLRKHISETCQIISITDFGELPVFENVSTFPMIFIAKKITTENQSPLFTQVKNLNNPYPDVLKIIEQQGEILPENAINASTWILADTSSANRIKKMEEVGIDLDKYLNIRNVEIFYGIKTGLNEAFIIDGKRRRELIEKDPKSEEVIKPLVVGDNIRKWNINFQDKWLIFTKRGIDIDKYPAIKAHLSQWKAELTPKITGRESIGRAKGNYKWYELQSSPADIERFEKPKIVYPEISMTSRFTFETKGTYTSKTIFSIPVNDLYLLGVLNSTIIWEYLQLICSSFGNPKQRGRLNLQSIYMSKIPIPNASETEREAISQLVQKCLKKKGVNCEEWETEINERVAALYGLQD